MKKKQKSFSKLAVSFIFSLLILNNGVSQATTTVSLDPEAIIVNFGEEFNLDLLIDFGDDTTKSGSLEISFDSNFIQFNSFEFDSNFDRATGVDTIDAGTENQVSIGFGSFSDFAGAFQIGTLSFTSNSLAGTSAISMTTSARLGGFQNIELEFVNAEVKVIPQVVPLPGAVWFLGSSLIGLFSLNRRKS